MTRMDKKTSEGQLRSTVLETKLETQVAFFLSQNKKNQKINNEYLSSFSLGKKIVISTLLSGVDECENVTLVCFL